MELECGGEDIFDEVKCALITMFALDCDTSISCVGYVERGKSIQKRAKKSKKSQVVKGKINDIEVICCLYFTMMLSYILQNESK